ncbi:uncharacterized protein PgNI_02355 [Pyricularia grisea]|uniref:Uncharacterized protein n=1 Tax=Pyricularia grisea TaxID=148305 RepID=A0A6P8BIP7_PYRGI|nr:uncharacterized protein PgNI_02355 [Pyricularia grisea]TLD16643.1 hypothetical protein PgNI_02355 [Pyricularia grisea]
MCKRVLNKHDCGHSKDTRRMYPEDPHDCEIALSENRRHKRTGKLLHCSATETYMYTTGGYCAKFECHQWYLKEYGWRCCQCGQQPSAYATGKCECEHAICRRCATIVE